jgi:sulfur-oxidizing protein SoxY
MSARTKPEFGRRRFLQAMVAAGSSAAVVKEIFRSSYAWAQARVSGMPLPDEPVEATLKRVFGRRPLTSGNGKITLELPVIAEDGGNVPVAVEATLPVSGRTRLISIHVIADNNRLPLLAKFSFTADSGTAFIATSIRLAMTTDVRAVAEMSDGTLYAATKHIRVMVSGCDLPPAG